MTDIKSLPTWAEAWEAVEAGRFGDVRTLRRLAAEDLSRQMSEDGCECGISSSDVNHVIYGAVSWAMQHDLGVEFVHAYLGADV